MAKTTTTLDGFEKLGNKNVLFRITDGVLMIAVPVGPEAMKQATLSKTGKSRVLGSTEGNQKIPGGISVGLNVYTPAA